MHAQATDGTKIAFDVEGDGEPLVLLPGQANSRRWWGLIRDDFAASFRTIAIDTVGTGDSEEPQDGRYSTRRFANDVVAVLDSLRLPRAHVYGTSMGGKIAQRLAIDHPQHVGSLVLGCTSPGGAGGLTAAPELTRALAGPRRRETLLELMFTPNYLHHHTGDHHVLGDDTMSPAARRGHKRASDEHDAWDELEHITAPTLVLHGSADLFSPIDNARRIANRIRGAELLLLNNARHAYFEEFRDQASAEVARHLQEHPLTP